MKRLIYSPKVTAYVKSDLGIVDISEYIVSGSVTRRINAVSSAELVLRNPNFRFTQQIVATEGERTLTPLFHPMDPIVITLTRVKNHPVQVFTGYIDQSPYVHLFPGTCTLTASCTLKRLLHTWWDPALSYSLSFLQNYGWAQKTDGTLINVLAEEATLSKEDKLPLSENKPSESAATDGSFGRLLEATMEHVGGWDFKNIHIGELPDSVIPTVTRLFNEFKKEQKVEKVQDEWHSFLKKIIGDGSYGGGSVTNGGGGAPGSSGPIQGEKRIAEVLCKVANKYNVPFEMLVATTRIESAFGTNMHREGAPYYGWYQIHTGGSRYSGPISIKQANDLEFSASLFAKGAIDSLGVSGVPGTASRGNLRVWTMITQGVDCDNNPLFCGSEWDKGIAIGKEWKSKYCNGNIGAGGGAQVSAQTATSNTAPEANLSLASSASLVARPARRSDGANDDGGQCGYPLEKKASLGGSPADHRAGGRGGPPWQNDGWDLMVPIGTNALAICDGTVTKAYLGTGALTAGWQISLTCNNGKNYFYNLHGGSSASVSSGEKVTCGAILGQTGDTNGPHLHFSAEDGNYNMLDLPAGAGHGGGGGGPGGGGGSAGSSGGFSAPEAVRISKASSFAALLEGPSVMEIAEAHLLTGQKSLMNDKPLMPFIEQLCSASLRMFMSLPNGDFFAFYPDYFGGMGRQPYWWIEDIEVLDGQIELSDDALATHVFVVGDTSGMDGINIADRLSSGGVINVFNAFGADFINGIPKEEIEKPKDAQKHAKEEYDKMMSGEASVNLKNTIYAQQFLQKYGPRPKYVEQPMIRSPYYETFVAYQTFCLTWAEQFLTQFSFTFMPEIFPGGLVAFPDHGIQLFVQEVQHTFSYEDGFTTQANLMAPSSFGRSGMPNVKGINQGMVRAFSFGEGD